ncbi:MAG: ATP synthase subunit alpha, partial [Candidatus Giovannonibacteria bacterium GW2011_GWA2_44_13b]
FVQFASDLDENTRKQIKRGELLTEVLKQADGEPAAVAMEVASIFAAINGFLDDVPKKDIKTFEKELPEFIFKMHQKEIVEPLSRGEWNEKIEEALKSAINSFKNMKKAN